MRTFYSLHIAGAPTLSTTTLRVAEVTQNSMRLGWNPLQGATGYILRWAEESGESFYASVIIYIFVLSFLCSCYKVLNI